MSEILETLLGMFKESKVTYDAVKACKVGKDVGNAMKMGDPDIAGLGRKAVGEIQASLSHARFNCVRHRDLWTSEASCFSKAMKIY